MATAAKNVRMTIGLMTAVVRLESIKEAGVVESTQFNEGHCCKKGTYTKLERKRFCPNCDIEVAYEQVIKLRQVDGTYAPFDKDEVESLKESSMVSVKQEIPIVVHNAKDVLPHAVPSGLSYYVYPDTGCYQKAYAGFVDLVARRTDKVFCSIFTVRKGTEYWGKLSIVNGTLAIEALLWPEDVAKPRQTEIFLDPEAASFLDDLIDAETEPFDSDKYRTQFRDALKEAEQAKVPGQGGISVAALPKAKQQQTSADFMELLKQSVEQAHKKNKKKSKRSA